MRYFPLDFVGFGVDFDIRYTKVFLGRNFHNLPGRLVADSALAGGPSNNAAHLAAYLKSVISGFSTETLKPE